MSRMTKPDDHFIELIQRSGSAEKNEALAAQRELAVALETPLRKGVLVGDVLDGIFEKIQMAPGSAAEFPLDLLSPGTDSFDHPDRGKERQQHRLELAADTDRLFQVISPDRLDIVRQLDLGLFQEHPAGHHGFQAGLANG